MTGLIYDYQLTSSHRQPSALPALPSIPHSSPDARPTELHLALTGMELLIMSAEFHQDYHFLRITPMGPRTA